MQNGLAEDDEFREEVKRLEEKFGALVNDEMRDRLHLEKANMYSTKINDNLEQTLRAMRDTSEITADTMALLREDTDKLSKAFLLVDPSDSEPNYTV